MRSGNVSRAVGDSEWVTIAGIVRTRGVKGELYAVAYNPDAGRYSDLRRVVVFPRDGVGGSQGRKLEVESVRWIQQRLVMKFRGVDSMNDAEPLVGGEVCIPESERPLLADGEFYVSDLAGCEVVDRKSGRTLGTVSNVREAAGAVTLELAGGERGTEELLIPFNRAICVVINVAARRIEADLPDGLLELNRS